MTNNLQKPDLANEPWLSRKSVQDVFRALDIPNHETRIVGGAVRNALIGERVNDIDMATTLHPEEIIKQAEIFGIKPVPTGIDHGTITLISEGEAIEVTTLRADVDGDGRHAKVEFGSNWHGDAARRDFTMNALYCNARGEIFDPLGGLPDLKMRRVKFIGDAQKRVREDYLRILRFIRFHGAFAHGPIDGDGMRACLSERHGLDQLSRERVWAEFSKILVLDDTAETIQLMFDFGLLTTILRGVPNLIRFKNLIAIEDHLSLPKDAVRRLGALTLFIPDDAPRLGEAFRLSQKEVRRLSAIADPHPDINENITGESSQSIIYAIGWTAFEDQLLLFIARRHGSGRSGTSNTGVAKIHEYGRTWNPPKFPVTGADLLDLGLKPGPDVGRLLGALESDWVNADFKPRREALLTRLRQMVANLNK